jgi:AcrR family transcriptional regulator
MAQAPSPATPPQPGRLQRRKARTRAAILEGAGSLFQQQGYEDTSIQQIAERADTGVGTLYGYFSSKEDILREVLRLNSDQAVQRYRAAVDESTSAVDRITTALATFADYIAENRTVLMAAFQVAVRRGFGDEQPVEWLLAAYKELLTDGIAAGTLAEVPVDATARMLLGSYLMAMLGIGIWRGRENDPQTRTELEALTRQLVSRA